VISPATDPASPLVLGVPSKGRLQEQTADFFAHADLTLKRPGGARDYRGLIKGLAGLEVAYLSASDIARELAQGTLHIGVTGLDLIHETLSDVKTQVELLNPLGFGFADVVVAVPKAWIDVSTMHDLEDVAAEFKTRHGRQLRVATKYFNLTRRFFARHSISDYRIVESLGATEGAPASGAADLIVDITTTGATLAANNLKVLKDGVILRSEAHLVASRQAPWDQASLLTLTRLMQRIAAREQAEAIIEIRASVGDQARQGRVAIDRFKATLPFGAVGGSGPLILHCPKEFMWDCVSWLQSIQADTITLHQPDYVIRSEDPHLQAIQRSLSESQSEGE
jgi:ATP phosphoribosyltransferase